MMDTEIYQHVFPTAEDDAGVARRAPDTPQTRSTDYRLAYTDRDFMGRVLKIMNLKYYQKYTYINSSKAEYCLRRMTIA